jgi:hypothetical protein
VLAIVQYQQQPLPAQVGRNSLVQRRGVTLVQAEAPRDGGHHEDRVAQRGQVDERHAVGEVFRRPRGNGDGQARLWPAAIMPTS